MHKTTWPVLRPFACLGPSTDRLSQQVTGHYVQAACHGRPTRKHCSCAFHPFYGLTKRENGEHIHRNGHGGPEPSPRAFASSVARAFTRLAWGPCGPGHRIAILANHLRSSGQAREICLVAAGCTAGLAWLGPSQNDQSPEVALVAGFMTGMAGERLKCIQNCILIAWGFRNSLQKQHLKELYWRRLSPTIHKDP